MKNFLWDYVNLDSVNDEWVSDERFRMEMEEEVREMEVSYDKKEVLGEINDWCSTLPTSGQPSELIPSIKAAQLIMQRCYRLISVISGGMEGGQQSRLPRAPGDAEIEAIIAVLQSQNTGIEGKHVAMMVKNSYIGVWDYYENAVTGKIEKLLYYISNVSPDMYLMFRITDSNKLVFLPQEMELAIPEELEPVAVKVMNKPPVCPAVKVSSPFKPKLPNEGKTSEIPF